ncbi:MAG: thiopurine S-methyltransferase [Candidatus Poseidoniaceae archaeon]|nr:thiopurine S-methyltransferase [Candidatus Poseidoniaceae archaeon]
MEFWHQKWSTNQIGFHRPVVNDLLAKHWPTIEANQGTNVLVPLCGKTLDMHWLHDKGHTITGIELVEEAVHQFFDEADATPAIHQEGAHKRFTADDVTILQGDLFTLPTDAVSSDAWYDRAAMVALPSTMRQAYVDQIHSLCAPGSVGLMITFAYPQEQMQGPPFSLPNQEVFTLFEDRFEVTLLETVQLEDEKQRGISELTSSVFKLVRI